MLYLRHICRMTMSGQLVSTSGSYLPCILYPFVEIFCAGPPLETVCVGTGFTGTALPRRLGAKDNVVSGLTRNAAPSEVILVVRLWSVALHAEHCQERFLHRLSESALPHSKPGRCAYLIQATWATGLDRYRRSSHHDPSIAF